MTGECLKRRHESVIRTLYAHHIWRMEFFVTTGPQQTAGQAMVVDAMGGDRAAMDALWHEHRRWIAAVLLAHKSPDDQVEDLLQEVAMTIVAKINTLREAR